MERKLSKKRRKWPDLAMNLLYVAICCNGCWLFVQLEQFRPKMWQFLAGSGNFIRYFSPNYDQQVMPKKVRTACNYRTFYTILY